MVKVLLCGRVEGHWDAVFERARKLNAAAKGNPFEVLFCIGGALPLPKEYLNGERSVPIATYVIAGGERTVEPSDDLHEQWLTQVEAHANPDEPMQLVPNLHLLTGAGNCKVCAFCRRFQEVFLLLVAQRLHAIHCASRLQA